MLERRKYRRVDVDMEGTIRFHETDHTIECVIRNISEEVIGAMIVASTSHAYAEGDVDLSISIPADEPPVKCTGRIVWYSMDKECFRGYTAGIVLDYISPTDRRRLEQLAMK